MSDRAVGGTLRARRAARRRDATASTPNAGRDADELMSTRVSDDDGEDLRRRRKESTPKRRPFFRTLARVARLAKPYFFGDGRWRARGLLGAVVTLCILTTWLMVVFSDCQKDMSTALAEKDEKGFYDAARRYVFVIAVAAPLFSLYAFAQNTLALEWRCWLTESLMERYFRNEVFYRLKSLGGLGRTEARGEFAAEKNVRTTETKGTRTPFPFVDNPEQRLCEDSQRFTETCATLLTTVAQKLLSLCAFLNVLYSISPFLVATCFCYSAIGAVFASKIFALSLTDADKKCAKTEADLRTLLLRVRDHAESVAFNRGGKREFKNALMSLAAIASATKKKIAASRNARLFTNAFEFSLFAVPSLVVAPRYFRGELAFGVVTQAGYAFRTVSAALNVVVGRFEELTALAAETERLEALEEAFFVSAARMTYDAEHTTQSANVRYSSNSIHVTDDSSDDSEVVLRFSNVSARVPGAREKLWSGLSLTARRGSAVLVAGPSGCGKSSIFRVAAGLWAPDDDALDDEAIATKRRQGFEMFAPPRNSTMFLPQETYVCGGDATLRDLVTYPGARFSDDDDDEKNDDTNDDDVRDALRAAGLQRLLRDDLEWLHGESHAESLSGEKPALKHRERKDALDVSRDWNAVLSPGERQRVAFARLFLRRPTVAFLDEATSFLDERAESEMYALAKARAGCVVSIGHRSSLVRFHDTRIDFVQAWGNKFSASSRGTWETRAIGEGVQ